MSELIFIDHPLTGERFYVALKDFKTPMTWLQAVDSCKELGKGWRLPNIDELEAIFLQLHKKKLGHFKDNWYWSSTEHFDQSEPNAWIFKFDQGISNGYMSKESAHYVRAILIEKA